MQRQSVPCSASGCALYWITNAYDDLNRLTQVSRPMKDSIPTPQTTTIDYLGRTTVVTDAQQKVTRRTVDPSGFDIYCWMPPSSYGGTVIVNGVETLIVNGAAEQCTHIGNTPGLPPAGSGGGGISVPMPTLAPIDIRYPECEAFNAYMNQKRQRKEELNQLREALQKADLSETAVAGVLKAAAALPLDAKLVGVTSANTWVWLHPSANAGPVMMPSQVNRTLNSAIRSGAASGLRYVSYGGMFLNAGQIAYEASQGNYEGMIFNGVDMVVTGVAFETMGPLGAIPAIAYKKAGGTEKVFEPSTPGSLLRACGIAQGLYRP